MSTEYKLNNTGPEVQQRLDHVPEIESLIPPQATPENQLADKEYVNSCIATNSANFKGAFNSVEELANVDATNNDYAIVKQTDEEGNSLYHRYKYVKGDGWTFEFTINNSSFTPEQWASINSAITSGDVDKLRELPTKEKLDELLKEIQESVSNGNTGGSNGGNQGGSELPSNIEELLKKKQDIIQDLEEIRSGAKKGSTAVQPEAIELLKTQLQERLEKIERDIENLRGSSGGDSSGGTSYVQGTYKPTIDESTKVNNPIGSIESGTPLSELKGKTFSELTDMMLVKEVWNDPKYAHNIDIALKESIVEVGSEVDAPIVIATWNSNVTPVNSNVIDTSVNYTPSLGVGKAASTPGDYTVTLTYSYGEGYYNITSNLSNQKRVTVPSASGKTITKRMQATYPWYISNKKQELVPINTAYTVTKSLTGQPVIKIPGRNSDINVQADLGFGYMDVEWGKTIENDPVAGIDYVVYTKPDSYSASVPHRITFTIRL